MPTENVIDLKTRKPLRTEAQPTLEETKAKHRHIKGAPNEYECGRCKSVAFRLMVDGKVICAECSVQCSNLVAGATECVKTPA